MGCYWPDKHQAASLVITRPSLGFYRASIRPDKKPFHGLSLIWCYIGPKLVTIDRYLVTKTPAHALSRRAHDWLQSFITAPVAAAHLRKRALSSTGAWAVTRHATRLSHDVYMGYTGVGSNGYYVEVATALLRARL